MKSIHPSLPHEKTDPPFHWVLEKLPIGLTLAFLKGSADTLNISIPDFKASGLTLTFINHKGDLEIVSGVRDHPDAASPGLGLLSAGVEPLRFRSGSPVLFSAVALFIPTEWMDLFLKSNSHFQKIEEVLENKENVITCRLGRRQLSNLAAILTYNRKSPGNLLEAQNNGLSLLEYFLCSKHRGLLGVHSSSGINNENDLSLIQEVESYISEYYCSDTFTVDSILKKTFTSYHRLNFLFKSTHGMTISEYIRNKRIEKSKEMIADNVKSISQIAYEIGYSSISNYILAFKKIYQITPGKYKKQIDA
jgi:AraC-like DNA-binding protein